jgi:hypothetical protein
MTISDKAFTLLPPDLSKCQQCAIKHAVDQPHNATTLYYGYFFYREHGRSPTWADAIAHCDDQTQAVWTEHLASIGIDIDSTSIRGEIETNAELSQRLAAVSPPVD